MKKALQRILDDASTQGGSDTHGNVPLEAEFRIGTITTPQGVRFPSQTECAHVVTKNVFTPGVARKDWVHIYQHFDFGRQGVVESCEIVVSNLNFSSHSPPETTPTRHIYEYTTGAYCKSQVKKSLFKSDVVTSGDYDIRFDLSVEMQEVVDPLTAKQYPNVSDLPTGAHIRFKHRLSAELQFFTFDITYVTAHKHGTSMHANDDGNYEVEIELKQTTFTKFKEFKEFKTQAHEWKDNVVDELFKILKRVTAAKYQMTLCDFDDDLVDVPTKQQRDQEIEKLLVDFEKAWPDFEMTKMSKMAQKTMAKSSRHNNNKSMKKHGSQGNFNITYSNPVTIGRKCIHEKVLARQAHYYVSEKSDGLRAMLVVTESAAKLIVQGAPQMHHHVTQSCCTRIPHNTVLDGEIVHALNSEKGQGQILFCVFDVITIGFKSGARPVWRQPFDTRIELMKKLEKCYKEKLVLVDSPKLRIVFKPWHSLANIEQLIGDRCSYYGQPMHKIDGFQIPTDPGFILQHNGGYVWGIDKNAFKLKPSPTLDLAINIEHDEIAVYQPSNKQQLVPFPPVIWDRVLRERAKRQVLATNHKVAEFGYDPKVGGWYFKQTRNKRAPNPEVVIRETQNVVADGIMSCSEWGRMLTGEQAGLHPLLDAIHAQKKRKRNTYNK